MQKKIKADEVSHRVKMNKLFLLANKLKIKLAAEYENPPETERMPIYELEEDDFEETPSTERSEEFPEFVEIEPLNGEDLDFLAVFVKYILHNAPIKFSEEVVAKLEEVYKKLNKEK